MVAGAAGFRSLGWATAAVVAAFLAVPLTSTAAAASTSSSATAIAGMPGSPGLSQAVPAVAQAAIPTGCYTGRQPVPERGAVLYFGSANATAPTTAVVNFGDSFNFGLQCSGQQVPSGIEVAPGAAVAFIGTDDRDGSTLVSPWGAVNAAPDANGDWLVLNPEQPNTPWQHFEPPNVATVMDPLDLLTTYSSCRSCDFTNRLVELPEVPPAVQQQNVVGFLKNVSNATFTGATITGKPEDPTPGGGESYSFDGANLSHAKVDADLVGASFLKVTADGTVFAPFTAGSTTGARLSGATFDSLIFQEPPSFAGTTIGESGIPGAQFTNTDLYGISFDGVRCVHIGGQPACDGPVFTGSRVPMSTVGALVQQQIKNAQYTGATVVSSVTDHAVLAGADLTGADLTGFSYVGVPLDLTSTKFDGANLAGANLALSRLHGATFTNHVNATGTSFQGADLSSGGTTVPGANFASANLQHADFSSANVSYATFVAADLTHADFTGARAAYTDFTGVIAKFTVFAQAHIYGMGEAFDNAANMQNADFTGAVLAADVTENGGFDFTQTDLTAATFDQAICVNCNFTSTTLTNATFVGAYIPGVILSGATVTNMSLERAWLYCGTVENAECAQVANSSPTLWSWPLALSADETFPPVPFGVPNLNGVDLTALSGCPDGTSGQKGCKSLLPNPTVAPPIPSPCSASWHGSCPTTTSTLFTSTPASPISIAQDVPPTWNTNLTPAGTYVGYDDSTIRFTGLGGTTVVAGTSGNACSGPTAACGDGAPAAAALLGKPSGLATGTDGTLYIADSALHRVRAISPTGSITTIADSTQLTSSFGVAVDPSGAILVADGSNGIRQIARNSAVTSYLPTSISGSVVSIVIGNGTVYAATRSPDYLYAIDPNARTATVVVGTGQSGYNGTTGEFGLLPGNQVQINQPTGLAMSPDGNVLFADTGNHLIRAYRPDTGFVLAPLAGTVVAGTPTSGSNANGLPSNQTQLNGPQAVAGTTTQLLVIADTNNQRILQTGPPPAPSFGATPGPPPPHEQILTCQPGRTWTCTLQPKPATVQLAQNGQITVSKDTTIVAGGHRIQGPRQNAHTYLITVHGTLTPGTYTITMTSGPGKPHVETATIK